MLVKNSTRFYLNIDKMLYRCMLGNWVREKCAKMLSRNHLQVTELWGILIPFLVAFHSPQIIYTVWYLL